MSLAYAIYFEKLTKLFEETLSVIDWSGSLEKAVYLEKLTIARCRLEKENPLRVVLVGEFSAGKSSIISALTGTKILIDADVATDKVSEYPWHGIVLVDTPGVQAEVTETDHDHLAREATVAADLVLFVITNELFNSRLAAYLRFVLDDSGLGLSKKTCVIVNKVDRESNVDATLTSEVANVLGPHQDVPIYLCAASKFLQAAKEEAPLRVRFERQSRFRDLTTGLDRFVEDAGSNGRLVTPLLLIRETLDGIQSEFADSDGDRLRLEQIRRERVVFQRLQSRLYDIRKTWKQQAFSTVMAQANSAVDQISEISQSNDLEELFNLSLKQASCEIDQLYDGVEVELHEALEQARLDLEEIAQSPLGKSVAQIEMKRAEKLEINFSEEKLSGSRYLPHFAKMACKPLGEALNGAAKNAKGLRNICYTVGKTFGVKFRPWRAVKVGEGLAKTAGRLGKVMPYAAAALDLFLQYREEKIKSEQERYLASLRLALRRAFADQAKVESEALETSIDKVTHEYVQLGLEDIDKQVEIIAANASNSEVIQSNISDIQKDCTTLRDELYTTPSQSDDTNIQH
jgi:GTPase SAR1 family protein